MLTAFELARFIVLLLQFILDMRKLVLFINIVLKKLDLGLFLNYFTFSLIQ
jgi:hypothetical protein